MPWASWNLPCQGWVGQEELVVVASSARWQAWRVCRALMALAWLSWAPAAAVRASFPSAGQVAQYGGSHSVALAADCSADTHCRLQAGANKEVQHVLKDALHQQKGPFTLALSATSSAVDLALPWASSSLPCQGEAGQASGWELGGPPRAGGRVVVCLTPLLNHTLHHVLPVPQQTFLGTLPLVVWGWCARRWLQTAPACCNRRPRRPSSEATLTDSIASACRRCCASRLPRWAAALSSCEKFAMQRCRGGFLRSKDGAGIPDWSQSAYPWLHAPQHSICGTHIFELAAVGLESLCLLQSNTRTGKPVGR